MLRVPVSKDVYKRQALSRVESRTGRQIYNQRAELAIIFLLMLTELKKNMKMLSALKMRQTTTINKSTSKFGGNYENDKS